MDLLEPWWLLPAALLAVPLVVGLVYNAAFKHRYGISTHLAMGLFVVACWVAAIVVILRAVR